MFDYGAGGDLGPLNVQRYDALVLVDGGQFTFVVDTIVGANRPTLKMPCPAADAVTCMSPARRRVGRMTMRPLPDTASLKSVYSQASERLR